MNGFLVLFVTLMDDISIGLHETHDAAVRQAKNQRPRRRAPSFWPRDATDPIQVAIVEFRNGKPVSYEVIKEFED